MGAFVTFGYQREGHVSHDQTFLVVTLCNWEFLSAQSITSLGDSIIWRWFLSRLATGLSVCTGVKCIIYTFRRLVISTGIRIGDPQSWIQTSFTSAQFVLESTYFGSIWVIRSIENLSSMSLLILAAADTAVSERLPPNLSCSADHLQKHNDWFFMFLLLSSSSPHRTWILTLPEEIKESNINSPRRHMTSLFFLGYPWRY